MNQSTFFLVSLIVYSLCFAAFLPLGVYLFSTRFKNFVNKLFRNRSIGQQVSQLIQLDIELPSLPRAVVTINRPRTYTAWLEDATTLEQREPRM